MIVRQGHSVLYADTSHMLPGLDPQPSWAPLLLVVFYLVAALLLLRKPR